MDNLTWTSISLTCVEYPQGDGIGYFLAYASLIPLAVLVSYVALVLNNRDLPTICLFTGQLINEGINIVAKRTLKHPRPENPHHLVGSANKYGMPSQHCQSMAFFTAYCFLYLMHQANHKTLFTRLTLTIILISNFLIILYSRVYLLYHYTSQCVVGAIIGSLFAYLWFRLTYDFLAHFFDKIVTWKISRFLGLTTWNMNLTPRTTKSSKKKTK
ncbi:dolichyldiphosphatase 1-like [Panonychus citri]|uniref:dolichyldiphosphatase 1-like n=1 Tax=Panonychus citri TaxID=50023 RepID=UPI002306EF40|nr:dolichyldiphosphatase 1-like [Panonychus citri]